MSTDRDLRSIKMNHTVSYHRAVSRMAKGVQEELSEAVPEMEMKIGHKKASGSKIQIQINGSIKVENEDDRKSIDEAVRGVMNSFKNVSKLKSTLEKK